MKLGDLLSERLVSADLKATGKLAVLDELARLITRVHDGLNVDVIARALLDRERIMSTAVGYGVAIPHAKSPMVDRLVGCVGVSQPGIDFDAEDGSTSHLFFALIAPEDSPGMHLEVLARISELCRDGAFRKQLRRATSAREVLDRIRAAEGAL